MKTFPQVISALRRQNYKHYLLLAGCCFFSTLLITAYASMMRSPTILSVLPEGGDSRKQVTMIFVLAIVGCAVFTTYASGLFFRHKSREVGILLALGSSKRQLRKALFAEISLVSLLSCLLGSLLGNPLAYIVWNLFRKAIVDTKEMSLRFDPNAYVFSILFTVFVFGTLTFMMIRFLKRTNIIDVVNESRKSEPMKSVPIWYGKAGILLLIIGCLLGYLMPSFFVLVLKWYAPGIVTAIFYLPVFIGLYMILMHTVVNGWRKRNKLHQYKNMISSGMMKFQGRQTVRNMLIITVLIAGAYFASFYNSMLASGSSMDFTNRKVDYAFHYRNDQLLPNESDIHALAEMHNVEITTYLEQPLVLLGTDGMEHIEKETAMGATYSEEYRTLLGSERFLSESAYCNLTGEKIDVPSGRVSSIYDDLGNGNGMTDNTTTLVTNPITKETLTVKPMEDVLKNGMLFGIKVLDDADYKMITYGISPEFEETQVFFNVNNVFETYPFAKDLFNLIVDSSSESVAHFDAWDPVRKMQEEEKGLPYIWDTPENYGFGAIRYDDRDSFNFRTYWLYMPQFRVLDKTDFMKSTAVFSMLFIFIAIICFCAVIVIAYTRSMTIALVNAGVYIDLRKLGASNQYLRNIVKAQIGKVFFVPIITGTAIISAFYMMILYFNDNMITPNELLAIGKCCLIIAVISAMLYGFYRFTLRNVCRALNIV